MNTQSCKVIILFIFLNQTALSQKVKFDVWINHSNDLTEYGNIIETQDSLILFKQISERSSKSGVYKEIKVQNLNTVFYRKKGSVIKKFLFWAALGFGTGYYLGYNKDNGINPSGYSIKQRNIEEGIKVGRIGMFTGAIFGIIKGSIKMKIHINGNQKLYKNQKYKMIQYPELLSK